MKRSERPKRRRDASSARQFWANVEGVVIDAPIRGANGRRWQEA